MDLTLLKTLRNKIVTAKDFKEVFEYFYDHFGENTDFFDQGEPTHDDLLVGLLKAIGNAMFKTTAVRMDNLFLIGIPEYNFIHGGLTINGAVANVLYCTDLKKGIVAVHTPNSGGGTQFSRFSADMIAPNLIAQSSKFKH